MFKVVINMGRLIYTKFVSAFSLFCVLFTSFLFYSFTLLSDFCGFNRTFYDSIFSPFQHYGYTFFLQWVTQSFRSIITTNQRHFQKTLQQFMDTVRTLQKKINPNFFRPPFISLLSFKSLIYKHIYGIYIIKYIVTISIF